MEAARQEALAILAEAGQQALMPPPPPVPPLPPPRNFASLNRPPPANMMVGGISLTGSSHGLMVVNAVEHRQVSVSGSDDDADDAANDQAGPSGISVGSPQQAGPSGSLHFQNNRRGGRGGGKSNSNGNCFSFERAGRSYQNQQQRLQSPLPLPLATSELSSEEEDRLAISVPPLVPGARRKIKWLKEPGDSKQQFGQLGISRRQLSTSNSTLDQTEASTGASTSALASANYAKSFPFSRRLFLQKYYNEELKFLSEGEVGGPKVQKVLTKNFRNVNTDKDNNDNDDDADDYKYNGSVGVNIGQQHPDLIKFRKAIRSKAKDAEGVHRKVAKLNAAYHAALEQQLLIVSSLINSWIGSLYETTGYDADTEDENEDEDEQKDNVDNIDEDEDDLFRPRKARIGCPLKTTATTIKANGLLLLKVSRLEKAARQLNTHLINSVSSTVTIAAASDDSDD